MSNVLFTLCSWCNKSTSAVSTGQTGSSALFSWKTGGTPRLFIFPRVADCWLSFLIIYFAFNCLCCTLSSICTPLKDKWIETQNRDAVFSLMKLDLPVWFHSNAAEEEPQIKNHLCFPSRLGPDVENIKQMRTLFSFLTACLDESKWQNSNISAVSSLNSAETLCKLKYD